MRADNICIGLLAHVDAGKTTLSESILYDTGVIRKAGRVDHKNSFLDNNSEERARGITIFSKQALFEHGGKRFTIVDTPGHADFSAETERALSVLDAAVLLISAPEGIHGHDITLWRLLKAYDIPVIVFINKMDQQGADSESVIKALGERFGPGFVDMDSDSSRYEEDIAMLSEAAMEEYLETGRVSEIETSSLVSERKLFPCVSGSALKNEGVERLLDVLSGVLDYKEYPDEFSAVVFKVTREAKGRRLCHIKMTGGSLRPKDIVQIGDTSEKADEIISINGPERIRLDEAHAGMCVAVAGLSAAGAGTVLGNGAFEERKMLVPLFKAGITADGVDMHSLYLKLKDIEEEIPEFSFSYNPAAGSVSVNLMGEVQTDVLRSMVKERFGLDIGFGSPDILYKETVTRPVMGSGHYEPLRHYAEAHVLIEPLEPGSGIEAASDLSRDELSPNYISQALDAIREKRHIGTLIGAELTDVRISLIGARAHDKHTEGGDFRQAVWRAIRQGLMKAKAAGACRILEPCYRFEIAVPRKDTGRLMTDLSRIAISFEGPESSGEEDVFKGRAAVSRMNGYQTVLNAYTGGFGRISLSFDGYGNCEDQEKLISESSYDPEEDIDNQPGSVFCSHGAGYYVPWYEAGDMMHVDISEAEKRYGLTSEDPDESDAENAGILKYHAAGGISAKPAGRRAQDNDELMGGGILRDKELEEIFKSTLGRNINKAKSEKRERDLFKKAPGEAKNGREALKASKPREKYLIVDGYNIIFAWPELKAMSKINLDSAKEKLADILSNYQGFAGITVILVFDAYKVSGGQGLEEKYHNIYVVHTKEGQTADAYIEKTVHEKAGEALITVATNDRLEQTIVFGDGAQRMSASELYELMRDTSKKIEDIISSTGERLGNRPDIPEIRIK